MTLTHPGSYAPKVSPPGDTYNRQVCINYTYVPTTSTNYKHVLQVRTSSTNYKHVPTTSTYQLQARTDYKHVPTTSTYQLQARTDYKHVPTTSTYRLQARTNYKHVPTTSMYRLQARTATLRHERLQENVKPEIFLWNPPGDARQHSADPPTAQARGSNPQRTVNC